MIICALLDTGFNFSLYTVKLSSRSKMSGLFELEALGAGWNVVESICEWSAELTIPHMGQPGLGANAMVDVRRKESQSGYLTS